MSKNRKPEWNEPVSAIIVEVDDPIEDTIEVGVVVLADGPLDPVPLGEGPRDQSDYAAPRTSAGPMPDFGTLHSAQDKGTDVAQQTQDAVQGAADKAKETAADVASKAKETVADVSGKVQGAASEAADKAKEAAGKIAANVSDAASTAKETVSSTGPVVKGIQNTGNALWTLVQRSPLQALVFFASLLWLVRHNRTAAAVPPVSINDAATDAAGKVGTAAGQVQATLGTLSGQVQDQAQRGAGWFGQTLQTNPLVLGAMALIGGAALGLSVPETPIEDRLLGQTRDELVGKVQDAAQDLTQKVTTVAQAAVHEAVESVKEGAKSQGLTGELTPESAAQDLAKMAGKVQEAAQDLTQKVTNAAQEEAKNQGLTGDAKAADAKPNPGGDQSQTQS